MTWQELIKEEEKKEYFKELKKFVFSQYENKECSPSKENIFKAFELTPFDNVKVVLLGQDPYPTKGVAMGLAFSTFDNVKIPKSLHNMFLEAGKDVGMHYPKSANLSLWAKKGVLLLNRILTVEVGKPLSHKNKGWEIFTKRVIEVLNECERKIVFILLGNEAKKIRKYLSNSNHLILEAAHPSPLSAYSGFFGSKIFSKTCDYLGEDYDFWSLEWFYFYHY